MYVIAIVGAGGKTSRIKNLTRKYVQQGKSVLITTTTHMGLEPGMVLSEYLWKSGERRENCITARRNL